MPRSNKSKKRSEEELQRFAAAMEAIDDGIFIVDRASMRLIHVNDAACRFRNQVREELIAIEPWVLAGMSRAELEETYDALITGHSDATPLETQRFGKDEAAVWVEIRRHAQLLQDGWTIVIMVRDISARKLAEAALHASEVRFRNVFEKAYTGLAIADLSGTLLEANECLAHLLGYTRHELVGMNIGHFTHPDDLAAERAFLEEIQDGKRDVYRMEKRYLSRQGDLLWVDLLVTAVPDAHGKPFETIGLILDITDRKRAETELRIAATAFDSDTAMLVTDADGRILKINKAMAESSGYSVDEVVGRTPKLFQSGRHGEDFYRDMWETIRRTGRWQGEVWDRRKCGEVYPKWLTISAVVGTDGGVTNYIGSHYDISEQKKAEEKIEALAFFDQLTGLPNRTLLLDRLKQAMTSSGRSGRYSALLFVDLDNFKTLNDTLGHVIGDAFLTLVAQRLKSCVREVDTVARLGGDDFVIILSSLSASEAEAAVSTEAIAENILASLNLPYRLNEAIHRGTASIGATLFKGTRISSEDLMKQADLTMYKAKAAGRNTCHFFDPAMEIAVRERAALEKDFRTALDDQQFLLHYQAQVTSEQRMIGAEVLVRWQHPQRGMISPADFIPLAEETGLILPLGHWVLEAACKQLAKWAGQAEFDALTIAVNVSVRQFRQVDFVAEVLSVLKSTGANPSRLKLELTESLLVDNVENIIEKMFALKAKGIGFSLDDFGTGYSSLSYLKRLPLDQLKIDQSFVRDVLIDPNDAAIARTVVALADSLGLGVIAEGVETAAQRDFLEAAGCHAYQGYFFGRPLALDDFELLASRVPMPIQ
ncbi:sensor domain-containing protein [Ferribacterium limneticum]|uniref:sensor domain-containing protein n=1 Tax=Ferribacterium limneticum TaxID=76259 RepID=UPI001CF8F76F|nr:EAL domain-containing protein [Ferribacterium limneticum]UCV21057.1 EAL domain-containing protein [Ferribacterium limneticum]